MRKVLLQMTEMFYFQICYRGYLSWIMIYININNITLTMKSFSSLQVISCLEVGLTNHHVILGDPLSPMLIRHSFDGRNPCFSEFNFLSCCWLREDMTTSVITLRYTTKWWHGYSCIARDLWHRIALVNNFRSHVCWSCLQAVCTRHYWLMCWCDSGDIWRAVKVLDSSLVYIKQLKI